MSNFRFGVALCALLVVGGGVQTANAATMDDVLKRLEALEKENSTLRQRVRSLESPRGTPGARPSQQAVPRGDGGAANPELAQARSMPPVKGAPIQFVRVCDLYGNGFFYVPGTDLCIKIGGYIRLQTEYNAGASGVVLGASNLASQGRFNRVDTNDINYTARAVMSLDGRYQTPYGTARGYFRFGTEISTPLGSALAPTLFWDRGFIDFAGFTVGKARSQFDIFGTGGFLTYSNPRTSGDTNLLGTVLASYTYRFGDGFSGTVSVEDPGGHNKSGAVDASQASFHLGSITYDNALNLQDSETNGFLVPDIIANLRVDQAWGYAGVSGALHRVAGAYFNTGNSVINGHPADKFGYAVAVGGMLNVPGTPGDTFGVNVVFSEGAVGFAQNGHVWMLYKNSDSVGLGWAADGIFDKAGGVSTELQLTRAWSINAAYQHVWNPQWRTSIYGGYVSIDYNSTATAIINSHLPGASGSVICGVPVAGSVFPPINLPVGGGGNSCNPDFSFFQVGTRTQWNPMPQLDVGLDVLYTRLYSAYKGTAPGIVGPNGPRPAVNQVDDQNIVSAIVRAQLNFYP